MAKFFKQKVHNKKKTITQIIIISVCVIGIVACLFITYYFNSRLPKDAVIKIRDSIAIEIHDDLPDKTTYFSELKNVKEENIDVIYKNVDKDKVGDYEVTIKVFRKKYKTTLKVVDTEAPVLEVKDINILTGKKYSANDFVKSCSDNSNDKCIIEFYDLATDQDGNKINYEDFSKEGSYEIQIIAKDETGNQTAPQKVKLTISKNENEKPIEKPESNTCKYGNNDYDEQKYILAINVSEKDCALNPDLEKDENILKAIKNLSNSEIQKLKNQFKTLNLNESMYLNIHQNPIPNKENTGLVGYSLEIEMANSKNEVIEKYFIKDDGTRIYSVNKYKLK